MPSNLIVVIVSAVTEHFPARETPIYRLVLYKQCTVRYYSRYKNLNIISVITPLIFCTPAILAPFFSPSCYSPTRYFLVFFSFRARLREVYGLIMCGLIIV